MEEGRIAMTCFWGTMGVLLAAAVIYAAVRLTVELVNSLGDRTSKARAVLENRELYLEREMYEELDYIKKYQKQLEKGEWPLEMNRKFEYMDRDDRRKVVTITEDGMTVKPMLKLKDKFKKKKDTKKDSDTHKGDAAQANNKKDDNKDNNKK